MFGFFSVLTVAETQLVSRRRLASRRINVNDRHFKAFVRLDLHFQQPFRPVSRRTLIGSFAAGLGRVLVRVGGGGGGVRRAERAAGKRTSLSPQTEQ